MRGRLGKATMVPDDFRSTDTVRFPTCLDGFRKHFLDITRVLDTTDVDFWRHSIRGAEMDAANTAQTLIEVLLERDVPDTVQLNLVFAQVKAATLDDEFGLGQGVLLMPPKAAVGRRCRFLSVSGNPSRRTDNCLENSATVLLLVS